MTLLEHFERTGTANTLIRQLSAGFPEFSSTDAIAIRRTWAEIKPILPQRG